MLHAAAIKVAAGALAAGGITVTGVSATGHCSPGQVVTSFGCGTVTQTLPDESRQGTGVTSAVTVDVDFRDAGGSRTDSGISHNDVFEWLGGRKPGKNGDGTLIEVKQVTHGKGGWGPAYIGWIPEKYTQAPMMFHKAPKADTPKKNETAGTSPSSTPTVETEQGG